MPEITPNLGLKKPLGNETVSRAAYNENLDIMDQNAAKSSNLAAHLAENAQQAHGGVNAGTGNKDTQEIKTLLVDTDTRSIEVTRTSGQISSLAVKDPSDGSTVATVTVNRTSGQISSLVLVAGGKTVTTTVNRTSGQITSITKAVV